MKSAITPCCSNSDSVGVKKTTSFKNGFMSFVSSALIIILPIGGLLIAIFTVWRMSRESTVEELGLGDSIGYQAWRFSVRYVAPFGVIVIFLNAIGVFKLLGFV